MKRFSLAMILFCGMWLAVTVPAKAAPCLIVTLTVTQSGPFVFNGQAGAGTLVRYGDDGNDCAAINLQFDAGRGTNMRLSQINVTPVQLNAIFFTHMHGDHTEGFADIFLDIRSSGETGGGSLHHRALSVSSDLGAGPGERVSAAGFLSPKLGLRSRRDGKARGSEAPYAHASWSIARSGDTQSPEGSGRSVNAS